MKGNVYYQDTLAGVVEQTDFGYRFTYDSTYLENGQLISLTLPLQQEPFDSEIMIPFFDGLIPEGWLLEVAQEYWKIKPSDRMRLLLTVCEDCIGAVCVVNQERESNG